MANPDITFESRIDEIDRGRHVQPSIYNQIGNTCMAYALHMCLEFGLDRRQAKSFSKCDEYRLKLSLEHILDRNYRELDDTGRLYPKVNLWQMLQWVEEKGIAYDCKYRKGDQIKSEDLHKCPPWWPVPKSDAARAFDIVCEYLEQEGPILATFRCTPDICLGDGLEIYEGVEGNHPQKVGHTAVVTGAGYDGAGRKVIEFINSWGPEWGYNGRGYVYASAVENYFVMRHDMAKNEPKTVPSGSGIASGSGNISSGSGS